MKIKIYRDKLAPTQMIGYPIPAPFVCTDTFYDGCIHYIGFTWWQWHFYIAIIKR